MINKGLLSNVKFINEVIKFVIFIDLGNCYISQMGVFNMSDMVEIEVPFCGLYNTVFDAEINFRLDNEATNLLEQDEFGESYPDLEHQDVVEGFHHVADFSDVHTGIAKTYVDSFFKKVREKTDIDIGSHEYSGMVSPKQYNFSNDRVFAKVPLSKMQAMFESHKEDSFKNLKKIIEHRHTSRDGFASYYSAEVKDWLEKPLVEWDHNELSTLLIATLDNEIHDYLGFIQDVEISVIEDNMTDIFMPEYDEGKFREFLASEQERYNEEHTLGNY